MAPTTLNESKNGSTVKVKVGEPIVIELPGNPTTGYSWFREGMLDVEDPNCDLFSIKKSYGQSPSGLGMMGAGGTFTFEVTAKQKGSHPLKLVYVRPWMKDQPPEKTFSVQIDSTA